MRVLINGEAKEIRASITLTELVREYSLADERIAIELNKVVVRKKDWAFVQINDADNIEIVQFVGGG